ncbi:hypothetical protein ACQVQT_25210 [Bacillus paranthracis]|jgi:hypothetical protein|uniref:Bacteriocin n=1 Tax=Bacillus paranthracis TaxID=2026186 RepID=A0A5M9GH55_9BACI|nr:MULTISPECIES: hypothetical protein [Bacillus]EEK98006.1 hypothetical protein bcere0013_48680 [Bacillus cereus BDRD-ST26]EJP83058.1 hypothetical protein IAU_05586 [Bacillus cereus IS075]EJP96052.1 hypothetical protein IC5_05504 [Bacillus cereus AND1407]EOO82567.1 hypothetical protein IGS_05710 [Bacillus cereus IS845/00]EOO92173.1 hypothetical protein IGQ_05850 [Bacillus cereus IS195]KMP42966.1 hypothetical protein TU55_19325 [Bacillus cereus]MBR2787312.1 hypothetical protein [Clostridia ba
MKTIKKLNSLTDQEMLNTNGGSADDIYEGIGYWIGKVGKQYKKATDNYNKNRNKYCGNLSRKDC